MMTVPRKSHSKLET